MDYPQGTVATVSGSINYVGDFTGQFNVVLVKVKEAGWKIHSINVVVPLNKPKPKQMANGF